jgi:hypothetical protein
MAIKRGAVTTWDILDSRRNWNMSKQIMTYYPDASLFTVMLLRTRRGACDSIKTFWPEDTDDAYRTLINNAGGYAANVDSIVVDDSTPYLKGDVIMNARTMEHMFIDQDPADSTNTLHVIRGYGETAAAAINDNDPIMKLTNASPEASYAPESRASQPSELYNIVQHSRTATEVSRTNEQEAKKYGRSERQRLGQKNLLTHRKGLERSILWGERHYNATNQDACTAGGLLTTFIKSNIYHVGGTLTENKLYDFSEMSFGSSDATQKVLVCSPRVITVLTKIVASKITLPAPVKRYGMQLRSLITPHGTFLLVESKALEFEFAYEAVSVDMDNIEFDIYAGNSTKLWPNVKTDNGYDGFKDEYRTQWTLKVTLEKKHARLVEVEN